MYTQSGLFSAGGDIVCRTENIDILLDSRILNEEEEVDVILNFLTRQLNFCFVEKPF